jgi:hypothetical protein
METTMNISVKQPALRSAKTTTTVATDLTQPQQTGAKLVVSTLEAQGVTHVFGIPRSLVPLLLGIGSGAAMIPFTMIKEANPPDVKGTAAGVMNFLVFLKTGIISPFVSQLMSPALNAPLSLHEFQQGLLPLIVGIVLAILLSFIIRETGVGSPATRRVQPAAAA